MSKRTSRPVVQKPRPAQPPRRLQKPPTPLARAEAKPALHDVTPEEQELMNRVARFLEHRGLECVIRVVIQPECVANALGVTMGRIAVGTITIGEQFRSLPGPNLDFILAHEAAHICSSDVLPRAVGAVARVFFEHHGQKDARFKLALACWDAYKVVAGLAKQVPFSEEIVRQQELAADNWAVCALHQTLGSWREATRIASETLLTLVGGDLNAPSHAWETRGHEFPLMTIGERINALHHHFAIVIQNEIVREALSNWNPGASVAAPVTFARLPRPKSRSKS